MSTTRKEANHPDPISVHVQFLDSVPPGSIQIRIDELRIGRRNSVLQLSILAGKGDQPKTYLTAIATMGNFVSEKGPSHPTIPSISADLIPDREKDCERWGDPSLSQIFNGVTPASHTRYWTPKGGPSPLWSPRFGPSVRETWVKRDAENERWDTISLGYLCDMVQPSFPSFSYIVPRLLAS
jgi:Thioesterase-like superfamily